MTLVGFPGYACLFNLSVVGKVGTPEIAQLDPDLVVRSRSEEPAENPSRRRLPLASFLESGE